ncbi:MAG: tetratricopeptide repeat protein [Deltaproteobacteria bacterium]|nr:MAG: tetratricopeptide repeat protein [Deltaproteobacteria bacterium]
MGTSQKTTSTSTASATNGGSRTEVDTPAPAAAGELELRPHDSQFPTLPEPAISPMSSSVYKEQVRAALFQKRVEPVRVGRFILLERLGAGSMGEIYAAYDDRLDRRIALKLVRHGANIAAPDELMLREAKALAQVNHPNVVQIYDAGTHDGRLFIAMELIRGQTLTRWLGEAAHLPRPYRRREILRRFISAGRGLEAAHAAGVAHRDFKPDNVLVGEDGRVCVVDFGLARVLDEETGGAADGERTVIVDADFTNAETAPIDLVESAGDSDTKAGLEVPRLTAATRLTRTGTVMGTPRFMAPEQIRGGVPDQRSDQFSFCVALYHALYGAFPFTGERPQELLSSIETGVHGVEHSAGVAARLRKALCRGLSVEPSERFASMGELLAALEPGLRRRGGWIAGAVLLVVVAAGVLLWPARAADPCASAGAAMDSPWSTERQDAIHRALSQSGLPYAETTWRGVKQRLDRYTKDWRAEATSACRATHIEHVQSEQQLDRRMLCLQRGRAGVEALSSELSNGAPEAIQNAIDAVDSLPELRVCSRPENMMFGLEPPPPTVAHDVAEIREQLTRASVVQQLGRTEEALEIARKARMKTEQLKYRPVRAEALVQIARALDGAQTAAARSQAEALYFEALDIAEAERHDQLAAVIWSHLVRLALVMDSDTRQVHAWWRRNEAAVRRIGNSARDDARLHYFLSEIYLFDGKYAEAADAARHAIADISRVPEQQLELSRCYDALAIALVPQGQLDEALVLHQSALKIANDVLGPSHPDTIKLQINYGLALWKQGKLDRARTELEAALSSMPPRDRDSSLDGGLVHSHLSEVSYYQDKLDDAVQHGNAAQRIYQRIGAPAQRRAEAYMNVANAELKRQNFADALAMYQQALALREHLDRDPYQLGVNEGGVAEALVRLARYDDAMSHVRKAEGILARSSARDPATQAWILTVHGEALVGQHQLAEAVPMLEQALALLGGAPDPGNQVYATWALARALHGLGREPARVRQLADSAHAMFAKLGATGARDRDAVSQLIDRLSPVRTSPTPATRDGKTR